MPPCRISIDLDLEACLALAMRGAGPKSWHRAAAQLADFPPAPGQPTQARLADALNAADLPAPEGARMAAELAAFLPAFETAFAARRPAYEAAAARLADRLAAAGTRRDVDLGALAGLPLVLEPFRRGLRAHDGSQRLTPNRIRAIALIPSGFNAAGFWHAGAAEGGRHTLLLPCHDAELAALMADQLVADQLVAHHVGEENHVGQDRARPHAEEGDIVHLCAALGDASRRAILHLLARETLSAAELGRRLGLSAPAISHHLGGLRKAGLIRAVKTGARRDLSLNRAAFDHLGARLLSHLAGATDTATSRRRPSRPA